MRRELESRRQAIPDILYTDDFTRTEEAPVAESIEIAAAPGMYTLRVINGPTGLSVTSATISLNGKEIFGPSDFKHERTILTKNVQLAATNQLSVELAGKPDSGLRIVLQVAP